ncbi:MAG TPA: DUF309 domain-containing protein [Acidobacteriota bacterium]|nr:DUF309 domain-containing protein [Acidobacteriota bacterium]
MNDKPAEPQLNPEEIREVRKGVEEFNSCRFFECHETLEDVWHGIRGPGRDFFQGIIQVSVGFYHLGNGNFIGARSQLEKALEKLAPYGDHYLGMDLAHLRGEIRSWLVRIRSGEDLRNTPADPPKLHFEP